MRTRLGEILARAETMSDSDGERCRAASGAHTASPATIAAVCNNRRPDEPVKWILPRTRLQDSISARPHANHRGKKRGRRSCRLPYLCHGENSAVNTSTTRTESFAIASPETSAIPRLVVGPCAKFRGVAGIRLLQLALAFEVPVTAVDPFIFLASLASLDQASLVASPVGTRRVCRNRST